MDILHLFGLFLLGQILITFVIVLIKRWKAAEEQQEKGELERPRFKVDPKAMTRKELVEAVKKKAIPKEMARDLYRSRIY